MSDQSGASGKHANDIYGDLDNPAKETRPATPAATVVLLRDTDDGPEVLMLRKNSKIAFGGMWVFPGGRIDPGDYPADGDKDTAARNAAAREARRRPASRSILPHSSGSLIGPRRRVRPFVSRPGSSPPARVMKPSTSTVARSRTIAGFVRRMRSRTRRRRNRPGAAYLVTLHHLSRYRPVSALLEVLDSRDPRFYETRAVKRADGVRVALWTGDAGYEDWDADGRAHGTGW